MPARSLTASKTALLGLALMPLTLLLGIGGCGSAAGAGGGGELARWAEGPVRWLLLAPERRQVKRVGTRAEAIAFIESFWARRDEDPADPGSDFRDRFTRRVESADILYRQRNLRGSLTDRGRAYILLGSPSHFEIGNASALTWESESTARMRTGTRPLRVEKWGYRMEDLPPRLLSLAADREKRSGSPLALTLTFVSDGESTRLAEGEDLLDLAALAALRPDA